MIKRYGSEDAVRAEMIARQRKSRAHPNNKAGQHRGGFSNVDFARQAGERGRQVRYAKAKEASPDKNTAQS
jgi:hypothetical protein